MGIRDLQAANAAWLRDPEQYGDAATMFDPATDPPTQTPFNGILEILGQDPLQHTQEADEVLEQATLEVPLSIAVGPRCWFVIDGTTWKIAGLGGRDKDLQTINVQRLIPVSKKTARRRGT
jgi:hypothetical protein